MAILKKELNVDVVTAAKQRIRNIFSNGVKVYMSFSGGKDSIVLAHLVYSLIQNGSIDPSLLTVQFVDEEGMYNDVIKIVEDWRKRFMLSGAKFEWYCVEVKHFNCFNTLSEEETFVCWDRYREKDWIRRPPKFAIRSHPQLNARVDNYQSFLPRITKDGFNMMGVRANESVQRLINFAQRNMKSVDNQLRGFYPIYDWTDKDVWLYLYQNHVDFPESYIQMYQVGVAKNQLRISQFFSIDTAGHLVKIAEFKPELMKRVIRREPNAYLATLYFDSEMFRRQSSNRRKNANHEKEEKKNYKKIVIDMMNNPQKYFFTHSQVESAKKFKYVIMKAIQYDASESIYKKIHDGMIAGDPKGRTRRAIFSGIVAEKNRRN